MQKRLIAVPEKPRPPLEERPSLVGLVADVELTSEAPDHPIEAALASPRAPGAGGWRAAGPGPQLIRVRFTHPVGLRRIELVFEETAHARTQEFVLRWAPESSSATAEIVRQQFTFSPGGATLERESYEVQLDRVALLELEITPDIGRGSAIATLREWSLS